MLSKNILNGFKNGGNPLVATKAKNQWNAFLELLKNPEIKIFEAFYIYATMCYKNKTK